MSDSILQLQSPIGIVTFISEILSIIVVSLYVSRFALQLYRRKERALFLIALLVIQLLCILNAIISIFRCFVADSRPITGLAYIISLAIISLTFVCVVSEKFLILAHLQMIRQDFKPYYFTVSLMVFFATYFWCPFNYASMFNELKGPIADYADRYVKLLGTLWWAYTLGIDFVANYYLIRGMTNFASRKLKHQKTTLVMFLGDIISSLKKLDKVTMVHNTESFEQKKRYEYLLSVRYSFYCFLLDLCFLFCYMLGSFGNFTVNPSKAEMQLAMTHIGSVGVYLHMMTASMFFLHLKDMFKELAMSKLNAQTTNVVATSEMTQG
jgi:hypothetical protein